ncbi:probable G-protein coupled receptor Mth-like 1 [Neocloeon triangulifer]|uniref:probable G-protein coupled receptor Mth-like 1 n=1 Tax=Neocloeon triangulifer TaxID=2078957 RepID=UPI00286F8117|nr:probable G-protein coupled receptor Mth-like 1 [Neocloeon triangulifer]
MLRHPVQSVLRFTVECPCERARMRRLLLVLTALAVVVPPGRGLRLHKCCPAGQYLQDDSTCKPDLYQDDWIPQIFAVGPNGGFMNKSPDDVQVKPNRRPVCSDGVPPVQHTSSLDYPQFVLLENNEVLSLSLLNHESDEPPIFAPDDFCVDRQTALVCGAPARVDGVRKCCGKNAAYSEEEAACVHTTRFGSDDALNSVATATGFPVCHAKSTYVLAGELEGSVADQLNGTALQLAPPPARPLLAADYCLERVLERPSLVSVLTCAGETLVPDIRPLDDVHEGDIRLTLYPAGLAISAFFLAATLATSFLLPKAHHALHWRCQTCHVACLLVADVLLAVVQFSGRSISERAPEACTIMAVLMHFFFLAAFFWLNAMCFNIWWTFRDLRPVSTDPGQERFRYRAFSLYAWGFPLVITCAALTLDLLPVDEDMAKTLLRPRFGEKRCWFYGDLDIFAFFYGPVGVLLLLNFVLFAATTRELTCGLWRREGVKTGGGSHSSTERTTLGNVCLKLVVVMGVTWLADIVSWFVGGPSYLWYITDLINALQGVFIFIVVGCQPQVWAAVKRMWWCGRRQNQPQAAANPMSQTSQGPPSTTAADTTSSPISKANGDHVPLETTC